MKYGESKMAEDKDTSSLALSEKYHYQQQEENRQKVREQGQRINKGLKKLKRLSSQPKMPAVRPEERDERDDEPTYPFITLPPINKEMDLRLVEAYEETEEACRSSAPPPPDSDVESEDKKKKKRWFGW
jgi:hypothetical protein